MLSVLDDILKSLPALLEEPSGWDSLVVNRRKPTTYRVFRYLPDGTRVSLHRFDPCARHEAYPHPHPWPGAFALLEGSYRMWVGFTPDLESREPITVTETILTAGARYEIVEPRTWHSVTPLTECWTVMVNGAPWREKAHVRAPTTTGKDLDKMPPDELVAHLAKFRSLLVGQASSLPKLWQAGSLPHEKSLVREPLPAQHVVVVLGEPVRLVAHVLQQP